MANQSKPYIAADRSVSEISFQSLFLGVILAIVLGAANVYLGLYAGMTVSASIPAAVISMAILRGILKRGTILENNIVQSIASSGEALAAGIIFTVPALVIVGAWQNFKFWPTFLISVCGGLLGIVFMIPMRRALIVEEKDLTYPEGLACGEVLIAGDAGGAGVKPIVWGALLGALVKFGSTGVAVIKGSVEVAGRFGNSIAFFGTDISAALLGVGYIVKLRVAALVFLGGAIGWIISIPLMSGDPSLFDKDPLEVAWTLWKTKVRYMGVGAMLVGGLWSVVHVRHGITRSLKRLAQLSKGFGAGSTIERTDRDMPLTQLGLIFVVVSIATYFLFQSLIGDTTLSLVVLAIALVASFFFTAVSCYICGLVGSSNTPVSGMTICALLATCGLFYLLGY
ncbi:MAG: oligopeptide transporter, OPT family, partial [Deltaproteobacteria bacterium]|nr:oligopeptide transporter, OPT family [Deltaproteobacteria bacterium]